MQEEAGINERIGEDFGNYRLTSLIGRGGFAEVYLGEHVYLKTPAAIKILRTRLSLEEQENFYTEARTIAHLQHEYIVRVLEFGVKDHSIPYLVMEYAAHGTLHERFPRGTPTPPEHILVPFKQVATALQYAHNEKLIHRDIKPENMLIGAHNEVLLSDFGIALIIKSSRHQDAQDVAGTVIYMAPEQLLGQPTKASDQYALGVVAYEWLTGKRVFWGSFTEIASQHVLAPPPPLRKHVPEIPAEVERVILTALAKDQQERFASVEDFANALEAAIQPGQASHRRKIASPPRSTTSTEMHTPHPSLPSTAPLQLPSQPLPARQETRKRSRGMVITLLVLALLFIAGGGLAYAILGPQFFTITKQPDTAQQMQTLYNQSTNGQPQIVDALNTESALSWAASGTCLFAGGALHASPPSKASLCASTYLNLSNFAYQVEMTIVKGTYGGLIFRYNLVPTPNAAGIYYFTVTAKGEFDLITRNISYVNNTSSESGDTILLKRQHNTAIKAGLNQTNLLSVITHGPNIYLYINQHYVGSVQDSTGPSGTVGMYSNGEINNNPFDIVFRNLQIWSS